jgi:hypothetical protein
MLKIVKFDYFERFKASAADGLKGVDMNFCQCLDISLDGDTISVFNHKRDIIYDTK